MKRLSKRTLAWGVLTVGVLSTAAFADDLTFVGGDSKKMVSASAESKSQDEVLKLLLTDENAGHMGLVTAGAGTLEYGAAESTQTSVLANPLLEEGRAGAATLEPVNVPVVTAMQESPWNGRALVTIGEGQANIRSQASEESDLVGKVKRGDVAQVVEQGTEWSLITSGNATGYIKNEFLAFGNDAEAVSEELGRRVATVMADGLNVRREPSEEADICEQAESGKQYGCAQEQNGWVPVYLASGELGYVNAQYVTNELIFGSAITIEEEQAAIAAEQEAARKAAEEKAAKEKKEQEKKEAAKKAAQSKQQAKEVEKTQTAAVSASVDDLTLLAAIIEIEAGTNYEGGVAVGNVVLNRVNSSSYPNSISGVIYQSGQFPGAHNGKLAKVLARGPKSACYNAAQAALNGENVVGGRLHFNSQGAINYSKVSNYVIVGGNCFY